MVFRKRTVNLAILALMMSSQSGAIAADPYTYTGNLQTNASSSTIGVTDFEGSGLTVSGNLTYKNIAVSGGKPDVSVIQNGLVLDNSGNGIVNADRVTVSQVNAAGRDPALPGTYSQGNGILIERGSFTAKEVSVSGVTAYDIATGFKLYPMGSGAGTAVDIGTLTVSGVKSLYDTNPVYRDNLVYGVQLYSKGPASIGHLSVTDLESAGAIAGFWSGTDGSGASVTVGTVAMDSFSGSKAVANSQNYNQASNDKAGVTGIFSQNLLTVNDNATFSNLKNSAVVTTGSGNIVQVAGALSSYGTLDFQKGLEISNISASSYGDDLTGKEGAFGNNAYAYSLVSGGGVILVNSSGQGMVKIRGNMLSGGYSGSEGSGFGVINVNLTQAGSVFTGLTTETQYGRIDISLSKDTRWEVTDINTDPNTRRTTFNSLKGTLTFQGDGSVYVGTEAKDYAGSTLDKAFFLTLDNLAGDGGTFYLRADIDADKNDVVFVDEGYGNHKLYVNSTGKGGTVEAMNNPLAVKQKGDAGFTLANPGQVVDVGLYEYILASQSMPNGTNGEYWYLKRQNASPKPDTPSGETVIAMGGLGAQAALWWGELSDLRKRLGEVRYGTQEGFWAKVSAQKNRASGFFGTGVEQDVYGIDAGLDRKVGEDRDSFWLIGGNVRYSHANQDSYGTDYKGDGKARNMGIKAYATWAHADGRYADFVLAANRYNQDLSTRMLNGTGVTGGYHSYGFGASVEVGRMVEFGEEAKTSHWKNHWFIEPQAQLSYYHVKGRDFTMSNGMEVSQDNGDFLTGRLGLVLGKKFNDRNDPEGKRFSQVYARAGVNHEFMGRQKIDVNGVRFSDTLGGTRVYYGVGGDWQTGRNTRLYWQIEREHGSHYTKEFEASAGVKVEF